MAGLYRSATGTGRLINPADVLSKNHEKLSRGWGPARCANVLRARAERKYKATTNSRHNLPVAPDLLNQDFSAQRPNRKWAADITCLATGGGWLYLAVVPDLNARRIAGWAMSERMTAKLTCDALRMALWRRKRP